MERSTAKNQSERARLVWVEADRLLEGSGWGAGLELEGLIVLVVADAGGKAKSADVATDAEVDSAEVGGTGSMLADEEV
jgi:hypothetical protein